MCPAPSRSTRGSMLCWTRWPTHGQIWIQFVCRRSTFVWRRIAAVADEVIRWTNTLNWYLHESSVSLSDGRVLIEIASDSFIETWKEFHWIHFSYRFSKAALLKNLFTVRRSSSFQFQVEVCYRRLPSNRTGEVPNRIWKFGRFPKSVNINSLGEPIPIEQYEKVSGKHCHRFSSLIDLKTVWITTKFLPKVWPLQRSDFMVRSSDRKVHANKKNQKSAENGLISLVNFENLKIQSSNLWVQP